MGFRLTCHIVHDFCPQISEESRSIHLSPKKMDPLIDDRGSELAENGGGMALKTSPGDVVGNELF